MPLRSCQPRCAEHIRRIFAALKTLLKANRAKLVLSVSGSDVEKYWTPEGCERKSKFETRRAERQGFEKDAVLPQVVVLEGDVAGRQGFEFGARSVPNVVMARDFWFQVLKTQAVSSIRFTHSRRPESSRFNPGRGDILETATHRRQRDRAAAAQLRKVRSCAGARVFAKSDLAYPVASHIALYIVWTAF